MTKMNPSENTTIELNDEELASIAGGTLPPTDPLKGGVDAPDDSADAPDQLRRFLDRA